MIRLAVLLAFGVIMCGCSPIVRFTNPPQGLPQVKRTAPEEHGTTMLPPKGEPSRIDHDAMDKIIARYMDTPYQQGGSGALGLDCSGFVYVVYRDFNSIRLPLTVQSLFRLENRVGYDDLSYGDLVFFRTDGRKVSHVGIYLGDGKFAHASENRGVTLDDMNSEYFAASYAGARRIK